MSRKHFSKPASALADCLRNVTAPLAKTRGFAEARIIQDWGLIVGPLLAQRSLPSKLVFPKDKKSGGVLTVEVANGWAMELQHLEPQILEKIASYFGYRAVTRLTLRQTHMLPQKPNQPAIPVRKPVVSGPVPESVRAELNGIADAELKQALEKLAVLTSRPLDA